MQGQSIFLIRSSKDKNAFDVEWRIFKSQRLKDSEPKVYPKKMVSKENAVERAADYSALRNCLMFMRETDRRQIEETSFEH